MKVLFVMEHPGVGSLVPALRLLDERGHRVHLAFETVKSVESRPGAGAARRRVPADDVRRAAGDGPARRRVALASWLRHGIDYLRYLEPPYRDATKLRERARAQGAATIVRLGRVAGLPARGRARAAHAPAGCSSAASPRRRR